MIYSMEKELKSFKTAAVRRAAENLMLQKENRKRRHSTFRALAVVKTWSRNDDPVTTSACFTTTSPLATGSSTWVTPHGKATIVFHATTSSAAGDTRRRPDDETATTLSACKSGKRSRHDQAMYPVAHDLDEIHMLTTTTTTTTKKPRIVPYQHGTMGVQHAPMTCLPMSPRKFPSPAAATQTTDTAAVTVVGPKRKVQLATKTKAITPPNPPQRKKPTTPKPLELPHPPNIYPGQTYPPHIHPDIFLSSRELKAAWAEHYRSEMLKRQQTETTKAKEAMRRTKGQTQQGNRKLTATKVLQDHHPNMAPVSSSSIVTITKTRAGNHWRKLPVSTCKTRPAQEEQVNEKASPEHNGAAKTFHEQSKAVVLPQGEQALAALDGAHSPSSTEEQQQQSKEQSHATDVELQRDQERRRLRMYEVEALEAFGVSTMGNKSAKTNPVSTQFHAFLCWFKESVLNGQWVMENQVAPAKGWQTYVSRSILILHLKRTPMSYLLGATMYQRPSTQAWLEQQRGNPQLGGIPYTVSCNAMMELTREPILGKVLRKWTNWSHRPDNFAGTIYTYMIQKLIHTRRQGKLYQFASVAHLEHLLAHGPVNGRDLEVVTIVLEETPEWLV